MTWLIVEHVLTHLKMPAGQDVIVSCAPSGPSAAAASDDTIEKAANFKAVTGLLPPSGGWCDYLLYDLEKWNYTPVEEQQAPLDSLRQFGQLAHSLGFRVIATPGTDLAWVTDTKVPGGRMRAREKPWEWFLRNEVAACAARFSDMIDIQAQPWVTDVTVYSSYVRAAASQARAANPQVKVLAGLSTARGTVGENIAAAKAVASNVDGYWLNVPGSLGGRTFPPDYAGGQVILDALS